MFKRRPKEKPSKIHLEKTGRGREWLLQRGKSMYEYSEARVCDIQETEKTNMKTKERCKMRTDR